MVMMMALMTSNNDIDIDASKMLIFIKAYKSIKSFTFLLITINNFCNKRGGNTNNRPSISNFQFM